MENQTLAYKVDEAAQQLGISRSMCWRLIGSGAIKSFSVGRKRLVSHEELLRFIATQEAEREKADAEKRELAGSI